MSVLALATWIFQTWILGVLEKNIWAERQKWNFLELRCKLTWCVVVNENHCAPIHASMNLFMCVSVRSILPAPPQTGAAGCRVA